MDDLLNGYVFYVPIEIAPKQAIDLIEKEIPSDFFNKYHYIVNEDYKDCDIIGFKVKQFSKISILESNLFELIRLEKKLSLTEFRFVILKYLDIVEFILAISKWSKENLQVYMQDQLDNDAVIVFSVQFNHLFNHFNEVFSTFGNKYQHVLHTFYSLAEIQSKYIPECISRYLKFFEKVNLIDDTNENSTSLPVKSISSPELSISSEDTAELYDEIEPLVTKEEARKVLLERVFNVKLKN